MVVHRKRTIAYRLRKNKPAMIGLFIILLSVIVALLAYKIAPDSSPSANRIILEIGSAKPGARFSFLKIPLQNPATVTGWQQFLYGKPDTYTYMPIKNYKRVEDSLIVERYLDENLTERLAFPYHQYTEAAIINRKFYLGTDKFGRDMLSRLIIGTRVSLSVGIITVIISLSLGLILGSLAGYFRGRTDDFIMWLINVLWSVPTLLLVFAITLVLGKGFWQVFVSVGLTMWVNIARMVRGQVMAVRELEYIQAANVLGYSSVRIMVRHIWPNIMGPVIVMAAANFASAIVIEAGLSFLGVGVQPPQPSWGLMIKENYNFIITQNPALALVPGVAIMLLVLAFNFLGNGLRDAFDVKG